MIFQQAGYDSNALLPNIALGIVDGIDSALWCYAFASIIFANVLATFLPLGLVIMLGGWALLSVFIALTSRAKVHLIAIDEQAVVLIGSVALAMIPHLGEEAASMRGLATILAIMSIVSLSVATAFFLACRLQIVRVLELLPYPVVCGFMAGIGWLLLDAGAVVAIDSPISADLWQRLRQKEDLLKLLLCFSGGLFLIVVTAKVEKNWSLPAAAAFIVALFYGIATLAGFDISTLRAAGWMFDVPAPEGGITQLVTDLSFADVDTRFILSVVPQLITIVFLTMLSASMNLSAMAAINLEAKMSTADEMGRMGAGNLLCGCICSPPGYTDAPASILFADFGATTRWMPLTSGAVCLLVALSGDWLISYTPKVLIGATIFLFAFKLFYDWMYLNVRSFSKSDYAIVWIILAAVVFLGFVQGVLIGIILTVVVFVLRYSMIPAIHTQYSLHDQRSSVERSVSSSRNLDKHGAEAKIYALRGYLFFGTANAARDAIRADIENRTRTLLLLDLHRVTGIDASAMNVFVQIKQICDAYGIQLLYSCNDEQTREKLIALDAASRAVDGPLIFSETDLALERMEEILLKRHRDETHSVSVRDHLYDLLGSEVKVQTVLEAMVRRECQSGDVLFHEGDPDTGLFILESGSMSAVVNTGKGGLQRVRKFGPGSVIGELSGYTAKKTRTASVIADRPSVLYFLDPGKAAEVPVIHELVARTMGARMDNMNRRLIWELG